MKLHAVKFGLAAGILWGFAMLVLGLMATFLGWGDMLVEVFGSLYIGYSASVLGAVIGMVWALIDGFIGGLILAWIYNKLVG